MAQSLPVETDLPQLYSQFSADLAQAASVEAVALGCVALLEAQLAPRYIQVVWAAGGAPQSLGRPDDVPHDVRFATIWSNPPIRIGKAPLHDLLTRWLDRLAPGGDAWLVVQKHLGSDSLARWLAEQQWTVERVASRAGFRVLRVTSDPGRVDLDADA